MKIVATNKKAYFEYKLEDKLEAGLVLTGKEVKSARNNKVSINGAQVKAFVNPKAQTELWLLGSHFAEEVDPNRTKKLLVNRQEIDKIIGKLTSKLFYLVPLELYFSHGRLKVTVAVATRKQTQDKRELIKKRDADREISRVLKDRIKK